MKLSIGLHYRHSVAVWELLDMDIPYKITRSRKVLSLNQLKDNKLTSQLFNIQHAELLRKLSDNQLIVAIYFYLKNIVPSKQTINQWLLETMCDNTLSKQLTNLIFEAVINNLDKDCPEFEDFEEYDMLGSCCDEISFPEIISTVLDDLKKGTPIHWNFDDHYEIQELAELNINISNLKETLFLLEDHSSLIIGMSNSATSLIELLSGYKSELLDKLCKIIPIGMRDLYSAGSCLVAFPEIKTILLNSGIRYIEILGMDSNGVLRKYHENQSKYFHYSNVKINALDSSSVTNSFVPLFLKLNK